MCKEDIREGRKKYSRSSTVLAGNGISTQLVRPSNDRTHLSIATASAGCTVAPEEEDATGFGAYPIALGLPPLEFDIETHGDIVTKRWNGAGTGGARNILVVETFWQDTDK